MRGVWVASLGLCLAASAAVRADWPMARHDPSRTGTAKGTSDLTAPVPYWRAYLGGNLANSDLLPLGKGRILMLRQGRLVLVGPTGTVWQSRADNLVHLDGVADLDGDGMVDIVTHSPDRVLVYSSNSGELLWAEPTGEMGTIGGVRIGDLDGDGAAEVIVQECVCCGVSSGIAGVVRTFRGGFSGGGVSWTLPDASCGGWASTVVLDVDGDGALEVLNSDGKGFALLDGKTGLRKASTGVIGSLIGSSACIPTELDGKPGSEILCVLAVPGASPSGRRVFALKANGAALDTVFSMDIGDEDGQIGVAPEIAADIDGDGLNELLVSGRFGGARKALLVAGNGVVRKTFDGAAVGLVPAEAGLPGLALVGTPTGVSAYGPDGTLVFFEANATVAATTNWSAAARSQVASATLTADLDADGTLDVVFRMLTTPSGLVVRDRKGKLIGSASPPVSASETWVTPGFTLPQTQLLVGYADGLLVPQRLPVGDAIPRANGIRVGGFYGNGAWRRMQTTPISSRLSAAFDSVLVTDSQGGLLRLDGRDATNVVAPRTIWRAPSTTAPAVFASSGGPRLLARHSQPDATGATVHDWVGLDVETGKVSFASTIPGTPENDAVPGQFGASATAGWVFQYSKPGTSLLFTRAISQSDGRVLWDAAAIDPGGGVQPAGLAVGDWAGDGKSTVIHQASGTRLLSGADGGEFAKGGPGDWYFMPTLFDLDADGKLDIVLHGGVGALQALRHDLSPLFVTTDDSRPFPYHAVAKCPGVVRTVGTTTNHPSRLRLVDSSGSTAGSVINVVLAGGKAFPSEAAADAAKVTGGQLTSVNIHENLAGAGPVAVVGSGDGHIYGIDVCTGGLRFAVDLGAPVGEVVFGDTDGDGKDELIATANDGFLYVLRNQVLPAPTEVNDLAVAGGGGDIDETTDTRNVKVGWTAVPGAASYEVALVDSLGNLVVPYQDAGASTSFVFSGLSLMEGSRYVASVRARTPAGVGPDKGSDGFLVTPLPPPPDAGIDAPADGTDAGSGENLPIGAVAGGGCGCNAGRQERSAGLLAMAVAIAALWRRRAT